MKFSCDRCGKKYATAEAPAPGRVYKLKCKACGHLIVVKTPVSGPATTPAPSDSAENPTSRFSSVSLPAAQPPEAESASPPQQAEQSDPLLPERPAPTPVPTRSYEPTAEISMMTSVEASKPAGDGGYVDIFADSAPPPPPPDDPFLKAVKASLPDAPSVPPLVDPFADMRAELDSASAAARAAAPSPANDALPAAFAPPPPRPVDDKKKGGLPMALIGIGFAAMIGIVVAVAVKSGKKVEPPPPPPPPVQVTVPTPPPPAPPPPVVEPEKPKVEPKAPKKEEKREEKRVAKAEPPKPKPPPPPPPPPPPKAEPKPKAAKAEPEKPVQLQDAASALSPEAVQRVVNASRRAFEACITEAARKGTDAKFDGRKVALRLNVNPNGFVTYPTLDDVTLNRTDLGECLKAAARLMVFPKFQGDVFHIEVPLTLRGG